MNKDMNEMLVEVIVLLAASLFIALIDITLAAITNSLTWEWLKFQAIFSLGILAGARIQKAVVQPVKKMYYEALKRTKKNQ